MHRLRIAYLCTTFPELSETFVQREVRALRAQPVELEVHSLWGGAEAWEGGPVARLGAWRLAALVWWLPYWACRRPRVMLAALRVLLGRRAPSKLNALENFLGFAFALARARGCERAARRPDLCHATWATAPAAAAWLLERLVGLPYTMGAHAYDVFQNGGDWLLAEKLAGARLVHTTTAATRARLLELGTPPGRVALIRRGLDEMPPLAPRRPPGVPLRLLAIGRLVPKKGFHELLRLLAFARNQGLDFTCQIAGGGPLEPALRAQARDLALEARVTWLGAIPHAEVARLQREWADVFLFTGQIAADGDRDGLPNVIPEAMAAGLPVVASPVGGVTEAIVHGKTGLVVPLDDAQGWHDALVRLARDGELAEAVRRRAHRWVAENFDAARNTAALVAALRQAVQNPADEL